ncbi:hypothetical protein ACUNV4_07950 [Granulosicoccus sp. 3-233]|uniref:hypothetical protein n=1 Tax=Granulosicoccus sp. 3-233 TaxID=3417969 RepID=UPI003D339646
MSVRALCQRRNRIETQWDSFLSGKQLTAAEAVNRDIMESWQRSTRRLSRQTMVAPVADDYLTRHQWHDSPLYRATLAERENMDQLVHEGEMVAAIADTSGHLLWTSASSFMRPKAESVNFRAGGIWDESSAGTNAVGLSLELRRPVTVFSSEHFLSSVRDWVCYAAPIIHPQTRECLGVLDMSTTWEHYTHMGQAAVAGIANSIASRLPAEAPRAELEIHALGQARVIFRGKTLAVSMRQLEILCLLALNPQGLTLSQLHAALYGDSPVSTSTLKAELSRLRALLVGNIGSRPYRLQVDVFADFIEIWTALQARDNDRAMRLYRGSLITESLAPELEEWRRCIDALMVRSLEHCDDTSLLIGKLHKGLAGSAPVRERLMALLT